MLVQFLDFIKGFVRFDFGNSMWTGRPIVEEIGAALPALAAGRHHGDADGDPARHPARHHLGRQAEHLDRLRRARLLHRRRRDAVVLARHPDHPRHPHHLQGAVRHALDAADQVRADLGRPALQPEHADLAGARHRLPLLGGGHAHDALGDARGAARGLRAHRARQGRVPQAHRAPPRAAQRAAAGDHHHRHRVRLPDGRAGRHRAGVQPQRPRQAVRGVRSPTTTTT